MARSRSVALITAIGRREPDAWQRAQIRSVQEFAALRGHSPVRWLRCMDGEDASAIDVDSAANLEVITLPATTSNRIGIAATRNRLLPLLGHDWVMALDSDDVLFGDALHQQVEITQLSGAWWSAALCNDISATGEVIYDGPDPFAPGPLAAGEFLRRTVADGESPWCCSATLIDAELLQACGGWPLFPEPDRLEDTALVARVTSVIEGVWVPRVVQGYRRHGWQTTAGRARLMDTRRIRLVEEYAGAIDLADCPCLVRV